MGGLSSLMGAAGGGGGGGGMDFGKMIGDAGTAIQGAMPLLGDAAQIMQSMGGAAGGGG